ncbi:monocyte to macrophage differentiation factor 2 [Asbolus verrucosus]|uniref:Monocyte to macrophage differentiation factor 2 n=1 Tax=Asbolus verrucosus TaxID=1661398 RepID=A0A482V7C9_ASBVE|nr:monocyte to macrophage differentiation factor 2 [Asbolus verrucosus]
MNKKALPKEAYNPTAIEHVANVITHGIWIIPSILATLELFDRSYNGAQTLSALIYGATLIFLFSISTSFHCIFFCNKRGKLKDVLHRCDRAMIYVFIAGSYFPWLTLEQLPNEGWASSMKWFVWFLAHEFLGLTELKIGGALYVAGIMFFKSDGVIPCAHAIWHLFVVMAAGVHYYAILSNLYPPIPPYTNTVQFR